MSDQPNNRPSFSAAYRWKIALDVAIRTLLVLSIVVMGNYLGSLFFHRFYLSQQRHGGLTPITLGVLQTLTNHVSITVFYDRTDSFFPDITSLLDEYRAKNPNIAYSVVDYERDPGKAQVVKQKYGLNSPEAKNMFIFDCDGRVKVCYGEQLVKIGPKGWTKEDGDKKLEFGPVAFRGELLFTSMILSLENPHPLKAYFLQGHGEPALKDTGNYGYSAFAGVLAQNYIAITNLQLNAGEKVPMDCDLLIFAESAGEPTVIGDLELQAIDQYLSEGGRFLALFNSTAVTQPTGLEPVLQRWGVSVMPYTVRDLKQSSSQAGADVKVTAFNNHPIVNPLRQSTLQMLIPRPVVNVSGQNPPASAPSVTELGFSSAASTLKEDTIKAPQSYSLMAAVEQKPVAGAMGLRGNTRMVVTGDSLFLGNLVIDYAANRDFLGYTINWLTDRPQLLQGVGEHALVEYRLNLSVGQQQQLRWLLLAVLPGLVLLLGGMVWFVRRK